MRVWVWGYVYHLLTCVDSVILPIGHPQPIQTTPIPSIHPSIHPPPPPNTTKKQNTQRLPLLPHVRLPEVGLRRRAGSVRLPPPLQRPDSAPLLLASRLGAVRTFFSVVARVCIRICIYGGAGKTTLQHTTTHHRTTAGSASTAHRRNPLTQHTPTTTHHHQQPPPPPQPTYPTHPNHPTHHTTTTTTPQTAGSASTTTNHHTTTTTTPHHRRQCIQRRERRVRGCRYTLDRPLGPLPHPPLDEQARPTRKWLRGW